MEDLEWFDLVNGESDVDADDINKLAKYIKELNENKPDKNDVAIDVDDKLSTDSLNPVQNKVVTKALGEKVDKEDGKGLSSNDFTTALKNKLDGIEPNATSSPKVITVDFEQNSEEWESWNDKTFFNQYSNGLYYITGGYMQESGGGYYESVILLCTNSDDGGPIIDRLLITDNGDMYSNFEYWWEDEDNNVWEKVSVSQTDLDKAIGDVETSLENIIAKYGLGGDGV